jgi:uncharacterized membrane protein
MTAKGHVAHAHDDHAHAHGDWLFTAGMEGINHAGGMVLLFAAAVAALNCMLLAVSYLTWRPLKMWLAVTQPRAAVNLDRVKLEFGRLTAFALLLLVAADVLETLVHPLHDLKMDDLLKMGVVGVIRTGLAYFLGKEVEEIAHHLAHSDHGEDHSGHAHEVDPTPSTGEAIDKRESKKSK